jgi:hypothetical protein
MAASLTDTLTGAGVVVAAGGVLVGVGLSENAGSHHSVWSNPWFDIGCALVALGLVVVVGAIITSWRNSRQRDEPLWPGPNANVVQCDRAIRVLTGLPGAACGEFYGE